MCQRQGVMSRFVLLEHDHPRLHWDLMLEAGAVLWTWRLDTPPTRDHPVRATRIPDHRPLYLDYEGPVSGNRGSVRRWDHGIFTWLRTSETELTVQLDGIRLTGLLRLVREEGDDWQVSFEMEQP
jgi:hypothetical protein